MLPPKIPNQPKFCHNRLKNARDICDLKFVLPEKFAKIVYGMLVDKTPDCAKFCGDRLKNATYICDLKRTKK